MVFNSAVFVVFFAVVFCIYWSLAYARDARRLQNRFLLLASYFFYGWWDWVFLGLIILSTVVDYTVARAMMRPGFAAEANPRGRRWLLIVSMLVNLGMLAAFKYFDFFIASFLEVARAFDPAAMAGAESRLLLQVILPVGISFYTFQTMSYTIDVYRGEIEAERNFLDFGLFVSFFPQLVAGPIERAGDLMPQFKAERRLTAEDLRAGAWYILFGFFMKVYVADSVAPLVDQVYLENKAVYLANPALAAGHGGAQVLLASIAFIFQVFGDFAGYSTIALGSARLLGIRLTMNFETPEFAQNPAELWRRWHATLNRWLIDYVYIPLGGSRAGALNKYRNLGMAFLLTGLWHGANWTFVLWGAFMGLWVILYDLSRPILPRMPEVWPQPVQTGVRALKMIAVFVTFSLSATLFRAYDIQHAALLWQSLLQLPWDLSSSVNGVSSAGRFFGAILNKVWLLVLLDGLWYYSQDPLWVHKRSVAVRSLVYAVLLFMVVVYGVFGKDVIYFAF